MRDGSTPAIVSIVLLIAIVFISAISLMYWLAGDLTTQQIAQVPLPILGNVFHAQSGYVQVAIANLGDKDLPIGTSFFIAENGAETPIGDKIEPGEQRVIWFWGRYDEEKGYLGFEDKITIYDPVTGASAATLAIPQVCAQELTAYEAIGTEGFEPSMNTIEDNNGVLWMIFTSNETIGSHDIWIMNSTNGIDWNAPYTIAVQGNMIQEDSPQIAYNGTYYSLYRSYYNSRRLRFMESNDGNTWSTPVQTNVEFTDPDGNDYRYDGLNKRGFGFNLDHNNVFWIAYINNNDVIVRNSTDGINWDDEIVVDTTANAGKISLIQDSDDKYWIAYVGEDDTTIEVASSSDGNNWDEAVVVSDEDWGSACTGPSMIQDHNHNYFLFADQDDECKDIYVKASTDGEIWSRASWLPNVTDTDRHPSAIQTSDEIYVLAFADLASVKIRMSNDPMIWVNL